MAWCSFLSCCLQDCNFHGASINTRTDGPCRDCCPGSCWNVNPRQNSQQLSTTTCDNCDNIVNDDQANADGDAQGPGALLAPYDPVLGPILTAVLGAAVVAVLIAYEARGGSHLDTVETEDPAAGGER